jgi:2'-5' RNA ligase
VLQAAWKRLMTWHKQATRRKKDTVPFARFGGHLLQELRRRDLDPGESPLALDAVSKSTLGDRLQDLPGMATLAVGYVALAEGAEPGSCEFRIGEPPDADHMMAAATLTTAGAGLFGGDVPDEMLMKSAPMECAQPDDVPLYDLALVRSVHEPRSEPTGFWEVVKSMEPALPELEPLSKADASAGAMVAVPVPDTVAGALRGLVDLPDVPDVMHITLLYLGPAADIDDLVQSRIDDVVREVAADMPPLDLKIAGFGTFTQGPRGIPVYAVPSGPGLSRLQAELEEEISDVADLPSEHGWVPHITLGYVPDGEVPDLPALAPGSAPQWLADSLLLAFAREHTEVPLTGKAAVARALCPILCAEAEKQIIWYQAAVPGDVDTYGHEITLDEVEDAAHGFMENLGVKFEHGEDISDRARVVENFTMPVTIPKGGTFHGQKVVEPILEGTWMAAIHYHDKAVWDVVKDMGGGCSWGGMARKVKR